MGVLFKVSISPFFDVKHMAKFPTEIFLSHNNLLIEIVCRIAGSQSYSS